MKRTILLPVIVVALLFLAACGTSADVKPTVSNSSGSGNEVDVTLADNTIQSSITTFKVGVPYRFVIINNGTHPHNFNINPPVDVVGSLDQALAKALLTVDQQQLPIGGGTSITYTFPASAAGQKLEMSCLIRRHYEDGMRLPITVTN